VQPGRYLRIPTGIHGVDLHTRGGFHTGNLNVLGGGHKTSIIARTAYLWARDGVPTANGRELVLVSVFAADESRDGFLSRFAQVEHIERDALDSEELLVSEPAWGALAPKLRDLDGRLRLWDPRDEKITVEEAADELVRDRSNIQRRVLIVDSLQAAQGWGCDSAETADSVRSKVDTRLATLLKIARRQRVCVVVLSELSRAGYRTRGGDSSVSKLATFKESGGIEYDADQGFVLERVDHEGRVDIHVVKTRWAPLTLSFESSAVAGSPTPRKASPKAPARTRRPTTRSTRWQPSWWRSSEGQLRPSRTETT